ncbi:MAG: transglycosylase SLT domain-containing protein [Reyranellaceae bacterium]
MAYQAHTRTIGYRLGIAALSAVLGAAVPASAQTPQPTPKPATAKPASPAAAAPTATKPAAKPVAKPAAKPAPKPAPPPVTAAQGSDLQIALQQADRGQWTEARLAAQRTGQPVAVKYVDWLMYRDGGMPFTFAEVADFVAAAAGWPDMARVRRSAEERLGIDVPLDRAAAFFAGADAVSGPGAVRHVEVLSATAGPEAARNKARQYWLELEFDDPAQQAFLAAVGGMLSRADHVARLDRLLWAGRTNEARRMLPLMDGDRLLWAEARLALAGRAGDAESRLAAVPAALRGDGGLLFDQARYLRRSGRDGEAQTVLLGSRSEAANLDQWWIERGYHARELVQQGAYQDAYRIARAHDGARGAGFAELEFLSGWIALRFLKQPAEALRHFQALHAGVSFPISKARGAYWTGRAHEAMGNAAEAGKWYRQAALFGDTYYGQKAAEKLGDKRLTLPTDPPVTAAQRRAFESHEFVQLMRLLAGIGEERRARQFMVRLAIDGDEVERRLAGDLALQLNRPDISLQVAKKSVEGGTLLHEASFPNVRIEGDLPVELAVALGLARQESQFDNRAQSSAGALGLMQLMPATAQKVARSIGQPFVQARLTSDAGYNARLGSAYLADMLGQFGALELALAAYNAGPHRVSRWLDENGDPRGERVDMIDWVELIPYRETRNYVQRVMEGVNVYRQLQAGPARRTVSPAMR